ncbi:MAG: polysaccharide deacetylase family protein [Proteobacteria bacterium]|nr:polysaccharide deacetylase family protein [Pseudomonadota bacterium]MBW3617777.1 polysaccharide deacetylase family protein [Pseudomonadota bacterium]
MSLLDKANNALTRRVRLKTARSRLTAPVASFTFDDFPRSAWKVGGPILARHAAKATYYVSGRFCDRYEDGLEYYSRDDLRALYAAGHEVGCHTFSHRRSPRVPSRELEADFDRNQVFVRDTLGDVVMSSFAYPYGDASPRTKALAGRRFPVSRGIRSGVNGRTLDLGQLKAVPLEIRSWTAKAVEREVELARQTGGWIIFFSHDVSEAPSPYGATPTMLGHALDRVKAAGIEILPVKHAYARATFG